MARKTTDIGLMFESLIDDLQIQVAASVDGNLSELSKTDRKDRATPDQLLPNDESLSQEAATGLKRCSLCDRPALAGGLCSAHYQQWRYRQRKLKAESVGEANELQTTL